MLQGGHQSHQIWEAGQSKVMVPQGTREEIGTLFLVGIFKAHGNNRIDAPI
jgi:hypothetical protein